MKQPSAWPSALAAVLIALLAAAQAHAAAPPRDSYSIWAVNGAAVRMRFVLPMDEAALLAPGAARLDASAAAAAGSQISVSSSMGDCPAQTQDQWVGKYYILAPQAGAYRFEMTFACPDAQGLTLHDHALFGPAPGQVTYAKIQLNGGKPALRIFSAAHQDIALPSTGQPLLGEGPAPFARQGLNRLLAGGDALALVLGVLLLARRWRDLVDIALALAVGYGAAAAISLSGLVAPDLSTAPAAIGVMAAILGLCALRSQSPGSNTAPGWGAAMSACAALVAAGVLAAASAKGLSDALAAAGLMLFCLAQIWIVGAAPRFRLLLFAPAALFGLFDGAAWARRLAPLQMPGSGLAPALFGYDLGAFAALAAAAAGAMAALWLLGRKLKPVQPFAGDLAAAGLTGLGLFWFVSRLYGV
jgi:hypothetical protein